jgi:hypothetical protein
VLTSVRNLARIGIVLTENSLVIENNGNVAVFVPASFKTFSLEYRDAWTKRRVSTMTEGCFRDFHRIDGPDDAITQLLRALRISEAEFHEALQTAHTDDKQQQFLRRIIKANREKRFHA